MEIHDLGRRLAQLRHQAGMAQETLAREAGVSTYTVSRIERGVTTPDLATLDALARALGTTAGQLLDNDQRPGRA